MNAIILNPFEFWLFTKMDFESPVASKRQEDSDEEEFSSSELKESHLYKSLAESKRSSEEPILNYRVYPV